MNILSTAHQCATIVSQNPKMKTDVLLFYNETKGGVDACDERVGTYTVKFKCKRWHVAYFCNLLDLSAFNAFVIHSLHDESWNANKSHRRRLFLLELGFQLIRKHQIKRQEAKNNVLISLLPTSTVDRATRKRGLCSICEENNRKKCTITCFHCKKHVCKEHSVNICMDCVDI